MGRRKQIHPHRSGGSIIERTDNTEAELFPQGPTRDEADIRDGLIVKDNQPYYVETDRSSWLSKEHHDISEVILGDLNLNERYVGLRIVEDFYREPRYSLRFRVSNFDEAILDRIKLGHWPALPPSDLSLELIERLKLEDNELQSVILSGRFDGPAEGITGLVHLASLQFLNVRPLLGDELSAGMISLRFRVEILKRAFDACESLLENTRQVWKRSMVNLMAWLRPEVITSEARYGITKPTEIEVDMAAEFKKRARFDVFGFYEAIKPEKSAPMLEDDFPDVTPVLRPYQRRAAYWMVQKEKGDSLIDAVKSNMQLFSPLCVPVKFLDTCSNMFYNPFSGSVSMHPELVSTNVYGGILADEMGLGKTVELLACIFAHRRTALEGDSLVSSSCENPGLRTVNLRRLKKERVECICGAVSESYRYKGLWVQCDVCDAWQHADCVGYSPKGKRKRSITNLQKHRKKTNTTFVERDGEHICQICSELMQATDSPMATGATLIVCPVPILPQWHAEIKRHTRPGSLKIVVYEGVRDASFSDTAIVDVSELLSADIVLTSYDVLKEDLSHDSDRHEGDRHLLRFQKRYPVIPTVLTRISWWRICLDEAQMVESNAAAATEMALRLSAKHRWCITGTPIQCKLDDLYGLLKFLKASPFDNYRWWNDVMRDPYERRDAGAVDFTHKFFKNIMWRSSKAHVTDELQIPPQEECVSWLTFSAIEEHFYHRQHETCVSYAREVVESLKDEIHKSKGPGHESIDASTDHLITHAEASKLLNSLLKLRQACCHPQVGSSGLRSLQQNPMTMDEILMVLVSKTKLEGEEALRKLVIALNALAGIAIIQENFHQAVTLYKEALTTAEEHSEDFRLDPLVNIHILHNLAEILPIIGEDNLEKPSSGAEQFHEELAMPSMSHDNEEWESDAAKRWKIGKENSSSDIDAKTSGCIVNSNVNGARKDAEKCHDSCRPLNEHLLRATCDNLKLKYLSVFTSKLCIARQDFLKLHTQVRDEHGDGKNQQAIWWLNALHSAEQNEDFSSELMRKINEVISGTLSHSKSSRITTRFRSITMLKYHIQTLLDELEASREKLLDRLLEVDKTLENPSTEDIERVRNCRICQGIDDGPVCVHCEMDELFQNYEARLFRLHKAGGEIITSAEEAVDFRKKNSELNRFYWTLSQPSKGSSLASDVSEESKRRDVRDRVVVSKSPSELEVVLGVIKSQCKSLLGKEGTSEASKHLHLLEGMRREYAHARSLAVTQAQILRAHDEITMATSRLHLKEDGNDQSLDTLSRHELESKSVLHSNDKFMASTSLHNVRGKLRYLKRLVLSKQKSPSGSSTSSGLTQEIASTTSASLDKTVSEGQSKDEEEACPICQEKLDNQKMVFQCGHLTCCKCEPANLFSWGVLSSSCEEGRKTVPWTVVEPLCYISELLPSVKLKVDALSSGFFAMTELRVDGRFQRKWVMCPTCRQPTNFGNIAYADDRQVKGCKFAVVERVQEYGQGEESATVQGSYGTKVMKIEAVTRRILSIKSSDPKAKVLVFSSWNDVLDVLEHAFNTNGITYTRMKGGRKSHVAISEFRGQKSTVKSNRKVQRLREQEEQPVQVLLLLVQHGANGLNLLEAQHVILVEPLLNPAAEAQAINRVHRIGQERKTTVHRFLVKNTVEESIFKLNRSRNTSSFVSGNKKNQDQPFLTLKDVESLFATVSRAVPESDNREEATESLRHLPPCTAAATAAERRLKRDRGMS